MSNTTACVIPELHMWDGKLRQQRTERESSPEPVQHLVSRSTAVNWWRNLIEWMHFSMHLACGPVFSAYNDLPGEVI